MEENKITIIDVARLAGVSKGTVDRVVHNRGEVSRKSEEKVRRAIAELGYEPNLYASLLASKQQRVIACLMPKFSKGEYWEKIHIGFLAGGEDVSSLGVHTAVFFYDQYDVDSFRSVAAEMLESAPSGVVLPPLFHDETLALVKELDARRIPYVYVDTRLEEDGYLSYFGMPLFKSGALCASLLTERLKPEEVDRAAIVRIRRDKDQRSDPTATRRAGFKDFMNSHFPECKISSVMIDPSDPESVTATMDEFFSSNPGLKLIVMFNSRVHLIGDSLAAHPEEGRRVIGFDDLPRNIELLRNGHVNILISQHTEEQSRAAVKVLADNILIHKKPERRDAHMHMDILTRFNIEDY